jgi:TRAP-type C4-dicarboxylate transport system permease small subunit
MDSSSLNSDRSVPVTDNNPVTVLAKENDADTGRASDNHQPTTFLDRWVLKAGETVCQIFLLSAAIIAFEIIARYVFNSPTIWVHETTTLFCAICFLYAGNYCLASNRHIRIGIFYDSVSAKARYYLDLFITTFSIIYTGVLSWGAYLVAEKSLFAPWGDFRAETSGSAWDPALPAIVKTFLFFCVVLMLIQYVLQLCKLLFRVSPGVESNDV